MQIRVPQPPHLESLQHRSCTRSTLYYCARVRDIHNRWILRHANYTNWQVSSHSSTCAILPSPASVFECCILHYNLQQHNFLNHLIWYSTVQQSIGKTVNANEYSTVPYHTKRHCTKLYISYYPKQYHTKLNGAMPYQTILYHNKINSTIPRQVSSNGVLDLLNVSESSLFLASCASQCQIVTWLRLVARQPEAFPRTQFFLARSGKIVDC